MKHKLNSIIKSALSSPLLGDKRGAVLLLLAIICTLTTCKKYPEGGWTNVAIKHLFGGHKTGSTKTWHLKKYEVNGIDSTIYITPGNGYTSFENDEVIFEITYKKSETYCRTKVYNGSIVFKEFKNKISIAINGSMTTGSFDLQCYDGVCERNIFNPLSLRGEKLWKIVKLTNKELILTITQSNNEIKIFFVN